MAIDERRRHELYLRAEEALGPEPANTLMEMLPPVGWADVATKQDLHALELATRKDIAALEAATRKDIAALEAATRRDVDGLRQEMAAEFRIVQEQLKSSRLEVIAALHTEFLAQSKAMFLAIVSIVLTMSGLVFALAR